MPSPHPSFGQWLRQERKALALTQKALGQLVSCSPYAIRRIDADERRPSRRLADRLGEHLHIAPAYRADFLNAARGIQDPAFAPAQGLEDTRMKAVASYPAPPRLWGACLRAGRCAGSWPNCLPTTAAPS